ncbi:MAG: hypothetical protein GKR89_34520 [Candidatus Latescibacteria bacterium]|nr:hypothetical protein [Candidatus Latescibacterota bacterium]
MQSYRVPGSVPRILPDEQVALYLRVVEEGSGRMLPHRLRIVDGEGGYYPPNGHLDIDAGVFRPGRVVANEPDVIDGGRDWAIVPEGVSTVVLPARSDLQVHVSHGPEFRLLQRRLDLSNLARQSREITLELSRLVDMGQLGWMSADTHVHSLAPSAALAQMRVEDIDYVNLMLTGPDHDLLRLGGVTGRPHPVSTQRHLVYISQEIRDHNQGHLTLLGITSPIEPVQAWTGAQQGNSNAAKPAPRPNEPLNWEVHERVEAQGGLTVHAHFLVWPGHGSGVGAGLKRLDGIEWLFTDYARVGMNRQPWQYQPVAGYESVYGAGIWYHMLNCGARLPLTGGTDKMGANLVLGATARTYVKVDELSHGEFIRGVDRGATFVTNGPLLLLRVNGRPPGAEIHFAGKGLHSVHIELEYFSDRKLGVLELVWNGKVVERRPLDNSDHRVFATQLNIGESGWLAARIYGEGPEELNWMHMPSAAHTSPVYVTIDGQPAAVSQSARYMIARLEGTLDWARDNERWSSTAYRERALDSFRRAKSYYQRALGRALDAAP